jgi:hypothetical protein
LFLIHVVVSGYHGWSHGLASVPTTPIQDVFIGAVVVVSPIVAITLILRRKLASGYGLFSAAMLGAITSCWIALICTPM